jgi:hypothetical protein
MSLTKVSYSMTNGASVNVLDYGAVGDGAANDTVAIQAAIDAACSLNETGLSAGAVYFPRGRYRVTSTLNCTNSRVNGTLKRDGLKLFGEGVSSAILGNCGTGKAVIETTGSQYLHIEDLCIDCNNLATPASIGVLQALSSTLTQTQNQFFKCLYIFMPDMATANANLGSICIYNFGAEENTYDTCALYGNVAVVLTALNDGTQVGPVILTSYQTLDTLHSLGMTTFSGECLMVGLNKRKAPLIMQNITTPTFENTYIAGSGSGGSDQYAMWFAGNVTNMKYHGVIEDRASILFTGSLINSQLDITWGGVTATSNAALVVDRTQANVIYNSQIKIDLQADYARAVLSTADGNESSASSYYIANSQFSAFSAGGPGSANLYVPLNVAQNASSGNIGVYGAAKQPTTSAFATGLAVDQSNVTGDGTAYNLNSTAWTANYDYGTALSANGVFTAPLNGVYQFNCNVAVSGIGASHTNMNMYVAVNSVNYDLNRFNPYAASYPSATATMDGTASVYMTAGQTATLYLIVSGSTKTVNVLSGTSGVNWRTRFEGVKVA